jgi:two-component system LytT family response regulator
MSQPVRAVIIDDESSSRSALRAKLSGHCPEVAVVAECGDGEEGVTIITEFNPDLVFLDIEMPWVNGFTMLQRLPHRNFEVIFVTAYDHYAIKAIKFSALDYLVKPVEVDELKAAVDKAIQKATQKATQDKHNPKISQDQDNLRLEILLQNLKTEKDQRQRIAIPSMDGLQFVRIDDIIYLEAESNYTVLYLTTRSKLTVSKTLKEFEDLLPSASFVRIHHSYIINCNAVERYIKGEGGQVVMKNTAVLDVSKRKKTEFLKAMQV